MIWLHSPAVFWLGGGIILYQILNVHGVNDVKQTGIHTAEPLAPEPSVSEVEVAMEKLKSQK